MYRRYQQSKSSHLPVDRPSASKQSPCGTTRHNPPAAAQSKSCHQERSPLPLPFLQQLLPGMDTGDLIALLILLLLLAEGSEECTGVILTLVIFLFL